MSAIGVAVIEGGEILLYYLRSGAEVERFVRSYDMMAIRTVGNYRKNLFPKI